MGVGLLLIPQTNNIFAPDFFKMIEKILYYERDLFLALNGSDSPILDRFMWLYSDKIVWVPLALFLFFILVYKKGWKESLFILLAITLVITLCDQFSSSVCKPLFERYRPTHHPDFKDYVETVFGYRGGRYGFISSHAANAFGFATFMALLFRNGLFTCTIILWALITAYSRIYLGVHFISDVVPGILFGTLFGYMVYCFYKWSRFRLLSRRVILSPPCALYSKSEKQLVAGGVFFTIMLLLFFNVSLSVLLL